MLETLRWKNDQLEMIDQRVLPNQFNYLSFHSAIEVAEAIRSMVVRGAPAIGCAAAYGIALEAKKNSHLDKPDFLAALEEGWQILSKSRPTAVNLFWALKRMRQAWNTVSATYSYQIAHALLEEAHRILQEDICNNRKMGALGAELLKDGAHVLTYCNAGALATAGHGTALGVIRSAIWAGKRISVISAETRPFLQGARLTAWELNQDQIPVTLITDNMIGHLISKGEVDAIIVGADRVAANGDVANKIGTYMVAVLAKRHNIPFYVASPCSTFDLDILEGNLIPIEERPIEEIANLDEYQWSLGKIKMRHFAFDVTPRDLITAIITEKGIIHQLTQENIFKLIAQ